MDRVTGLFGNSRWVWVLLAGLLAGAAYEGWMLYRATAINHRIAQPEGIQVDEATAPELIYAKAYSLARLGDRQEAMRLFGGLANQGDSDFQARVRHNLGTLYLRDAAALWNARGVLEYVRVNTLVAEAKENLKEAIRISPDSWDARFNLEYAYRITPPPKEKPKADFQGSKGSVFATLPSIPGGGP